MELNRELLMSYLFIYLFIIEGEYGTDSNFESEWTDSESEMEGNWSDDVLSDNKPRSSLRGKRIHQKNCFSEDLFSVTIKVHDCTLINLALNKKVYSIVSFFSFQNKWYISYLCWHCKRHL